MSSATQIAYSDFDRVFFKLPLSLQNLIQRHIDDMGGRLGTFSHYRLTGSHNCRLRVGDYRVLYTFDVRTNVIHLLYFGNRREIYR